MSSGKQRWTIKEDDALRRVVDTAPEIRWVHIAKRHTALLARESASSSEYYKGRTSKQCRERWNNHLRPNLRKCSWSEHEDLKLIDLYEKYGNKFTIIGIALNRADIHVRNRIHSTKRMAMKHQDGTSTLNTRKDGVLFKYFLAKHRGMVFSPHAEVERAQNNPMNQFSWNAPGATIKQELMGPPRTTNNIPSQMFFPRALSAPAAPRRADDFGLMNANFSYSHKAPAPLDTGAENFNPQPAPMTAPETTASSGSLTFKPPPPVITADISVEYLPVKKEEGSLFSPNAFSMLSPTPTPKALKMQSMTPKFTPGSWSRDFSFWGGSSPRSSVTGMSNDFAVIPKPQDGATGDDDGLDSFISSYANQPFCLPEPSPKSSLCF